MEVSIIGTGTLVTGILQALCLSDEVARINLIARSDNKATSSLALCEDNLNRLVHKNKLEVSCAQAGLKKIYGSVQISNIQNSQLVIEAVAEDLDAKMFIFSEISKYVESSTIIASNTSSLSITAFAGVLPCPQNVVGLHFFNPAPLMELVEFVAGHETSDEVKSKLIELAKSLGKSFVIVKEAPGFVVIRILIAMINEAICILAEGLATAIDKVMRFGFGAHHSIVPPALADLSGNDVNLSIMDTLFSENCDSKYKAHSLLRKMVRANHLGRKTKKVFFEY